MHQISNSKMSVNYRTDLPRALNDIPINVLQQTLQLINSWHEKSVSCINSSFRALLYFKLKENILMCFLRKILVFRIKTWKLNFLFKMLLLYSVNFNFLITWSNSILHSIVKYVPFRRSRPTFHIIHTSYISLDHFDQNFTCILIW